MKIYHWIFVVLGICIFTLLIMCYNELKNINERDELNRGLIYQIEFNTDNVEHNLKAIYDELDELHYDYSMNN